MTTRSATPVDVHIGRTVQDARARQGLSQTALALAIGVTFQQIQKYEAGQNRVPCSRLHAIAGSLGMAPGDFFPPVATRVATPTAASSPHPDAAVAHRFRHAADILEGMTDGIDGDRLGALVRWALRGQAGADEGDALIRAFEAPWIAAAEEGEFNGDTREAAQKDIARISAESLDPALAGTVPTAHDIAEQTCRRHTQQSRDIEVTARAFPHIHAAFEAISHDSGFSAGHDHYFVPVRWSGSLQQIEQVLAALNPTSRDHFVLGEGSEVDTMVRRQPELAPAHQLLNAFHDDFAGAAHG